MSERNPALTACIICDWLWCICIMAGCTYVVFWLNNSGLWYFLAVTLCSWDCKPYRSAEQLAADPDPDPDEDEDDD